MIEIRGDKKVLITPISEEDLADIKIGDIVWLDGELMTCRDVAHRRLVEEGRELPVDVRNMKENTERACKEFGAIHCVFPAGNAVVAATEVEEIVRAEWRDLGMPETLWYYNVKEFLSTYRIYRCTGPQPV